MCTHSSMRDTLIAWMLVFCVVIIGYYGGTSYPGIYTFDKMRDMHSIMQLFQKDWYWLVATDDDYPVEFMFKYQTPDYDARYFGTLKTNVLRRGNELLGFVSYYKESDAQGLILFLGVDSRFRRQKVGDRLLRYAVGQLKRMGSAQIRLAVREQNVPARTLYERVGFHVIEYDEEDKVLEMEYVG